MKKTSPKTHEEWYVSVLFAYNSKEQKYLNAKQWYPGVKLGDRYCKDEAEARKVLENVYKMFNKKFHYNAKGERYESHDAGGGFGVTMVITPEHDEGSRIIAHRIQKRIVSDWETVEQE